MKQLQAKMYAAGVTSTELSDPSVNVSLNVVTSGSEENKTFAAATPSGGMSMTITNPDALDFFVQGDEYLITISKVEKAEAVEGTEGAE